MSLEDIQYTPAEIRQRYREVTGGLPSDASLQSRYGTPEAGACEHLGISYEKLKGRIDERIERADAEAQ